MTQPIPPELLAQLEDHERWLMTYRASRKRVLWSNR